MSGTTLPIAGALRTFVDAVQAIVDEGGGEQTVTGRIARRLTQCLDEGLELSAAVIRPGADRYLMYPLYVAPDGSFSIASAVWNVGQSTPIHDHGTWGVVGILTGMEGEERFALPTQPGNSPSPIEFATWEPGAVTVCCTTDQDLHRVSCASAEPCVGIHVYGADIGRLQRRAYDPTTGEVTWFVSAWTPPQD